MPFLFHIFINNDTHRVYVLARKLSFRHKLYFLWRRDDLTRKNYENKQTEQNTKIEQSWFVYLGYIPVSGSLINVPLQTLTVEVRHLAEILVFENNKWAV